VEFGSPWAGERTRAATVDHGVVRTPNDQAVATGHSPGVDPVRWQAGWRSCWAGRWPVWPGEPRRHARAFVLGLLADLLRKNCWTSAEHAGDATPDGMQHLLEQYPGDHRPARRRPADGPQGAVT
jgi:hypothetical protein